MTRKRMTGKQAVKALQDAYGFTSVDELSRRSGVSRSALVNWRANPEIHIYEHSQLKVEKAVAGAYPSHSREANGVTVLPQPTGYVGVPSADTEIWRDIIEALRGQREATQAMLQEILDRLPPRQITPERGRETTPGVASARPRKRA